MRDEDILFLINIIFSLITMGIDLIRGGRIANRGARKTKSSNSYLKSLINVTLSQFSSIPSFQEGPTQDSIRSFTKDSTNPDLTDILSPFPELLKLYQRISPKSKVELLLLLEQSPMMSDC